MHSISQPFSKSMERRNGLNFKRPLCFFSSQMLRYSFGFLLCFTSHPFQKVKKPIACGLHEIACLLGQEKAEKDLFNVLDQILKDTCIFLNLPFIYWHFLWKAMKWSMERFLIWLNSCRYSIVRRGRTSWTYSSFSRKTQRSGGFES